MFNLDFSYFSVVFVAWDASFYDHEIRITNASYGKNFDNRKNVFHDEQNSPAEIINLEIRSKKFESTLLNKTVLFVGLILQMQCPKVYIK